MQIGIDVKCMRTYFDGRGLSGFGDIATFKNSQISLSDHWLKLHEKFIQVGIDVTCKHTNFSGRNCSGFEDIATLKNNQISLSDHRL